MILHVHDYVRGTERVQEGVDVVLQHHEAVSLLEELNEMFLPENLHELRAKLKLALERQ